MSRVIRGLRWAKECARPACIPIARPRGVKAAGLRYERALARALPGTLPGRWFEFEDAAGHGFCQTDLLLGWEGHACVLECKYTWTREGHQQLEELYLPVVQAALSRPVLGLQVCRRLVPELTREGVQVVSSLQAGLVGALQGRRCAWHWLAQGQELAPRAGGRAPARPISLESRLVGG